MNMNMNMNQELRTTLHQLGWNPDTVVWGKRLGGSPSHLTLLLPSGKERTEFSPVTVVTAGDQVAVVRWG